MFLDGRWHRLQSKPGTFPEDDPIRRLDVSILQDNLLAPVLGIADPPQWILNYGGAVIGMVHVQLPFMVLLLVGVIRKIEPAIEEASTNLGASPIQTFLHVILPLSRPGLIAGSLLVFMASISALVTPAILGGKRVMLMALYIDQQIRSVLNYPVGATAATLTMLTAVAAMALAARVLSKARR